MGMSFLLDKSEICHSVTMIIIVITIKNENITRARETDGFRGKSTFHTRSPGDLSLIPTAYMKASHSKLCICNSRYLQEMGTGKYADSLRPAS